MKYVYITTFAILICSMNMLGMERDSKPTRPLSVTPRQREILNRPSSISTSGNQQIVPLASYEELKAKFAELQKKYDDLNEQHSDSFMTAVQFLRSPENKNPDTIQDLNAQMAVMIAIMHATPIKNELEKVKKENALKDARIHELEQLLVGLQQQAKE